MTTGGYDLGAGRGRGVGSVDVGKVLGFGRGGEGGKEEGRGGEEEGKVLEGGSGGRGLRREDRVCVVRDAGQSVGRLARWEFV